MVEKMNAVDGSYTSRCGTTARCRHGNHMMRRSLTDPFTRQGSAANTPIASAKRPKRRAQPLSSTARHGVLYTDSNGKKAPGSGGATSVVNEDDESIRPVLKEAKKDERQDLQHSPKARKSSQSSTPRKSGVEASGFSDASGTAKSSAAIEQKNPGDSNTPQKRGAEEAGMEGEGGGSPDASAQDVSPSSNKKASTPTSTRGGGGTPTGGSGGGRRLSGGDGSKHGEDTNRHKGKESAIFSPALRSESHDETTATSADSAGETRPPIPTPTTTPLGGGGKGEGDHDNEAPSTDGEADGAPVEAARDVDGREERRESNDGSVGLEGEEAGEAEDEEEEEEEEFNPYCFIAHLPPYNTVKHITPTAPALPEKRKTRHGKELTLVLDLDETLVHCTVDPIVNPDHRFEVHFNGEEFQVYVRKRPHLDAFLEAVSELFEVVVFTASQRVYAERLLNMIDPQKKFVKYRLYRDACMALEGNYLKDLNVLGRDLSKVAIVDNSPYAYGFQIDNGIPIESWFDDTADEELLHLLPLLKQLISQSEIAGGDVRPFIRSIFKTHELVDQARNGSIIEHRSAGSPSPPSAAEAAARAQVKATSNQDEGSSSGNADATSIQACSANSTAVNASSEE